MATYLNAYTMMEDLLGDLDEYSQARVQGTDTSGAWTNTWLMRKINNAARILYGILLLRIPEQFNATTELTGADSVYTLPWDFGSVVEFRDADGGKVYPTVIQSKPRGSDTGSKNLYYRSGQTFVLTKSGVTDTYTLFYRKKPREIHSGQAQTGSGATTLVMDSEGKNIDDYYNGLIVENITVGGVGTVSDYTGSSASATVDVAFTANTDYYGLVVDLPEPFHHLIVPKATLLVRSASPIHKKPPTRAENMDWEAMVGDAVRAFAGNQADVLAEELFGKGGYSGGTVSIPGQGYLIAG